MKLKVKPTLKAAPKKEPVAKVETKVIAPKYTDLRQVMDYTRDLSMFYSGVEYEVYLDGCYNMGIRNFLMSYEYVRTKGAGTIKKYPDMHLFIDSGAFTYMQDPKYLEFTETQWEEQIVTYLNWAKKHKDSIFGMAELDLQRLVGLDKVNEWRRKYFEPFMLETGIPVCFVYHNEGLDVWEFMCKRYPFVGFSSISDEGVNRDLDDYRQMLRIAEKYNSLVHGFGMTKTSILPELPFYTVDSTSWKSGFRYGQLAIWNGKKVQMFKKEDWEAKVIPVIRGYKDITLDEALLYEFYEPEILRASVYAYMKAEDFIVDRLKSLAYWKKAKVTKINVDNLPDDFFPTEEWFEGEQSDFANYARKMNINPDYDEARNLINDVTTFMNWNNPDYTRMKEWYLKDENVGLITELHDQYINRIVPDLDAKIEDLTNFFKDCIAGNNDKLLQLGTNFDRMTKERDSYVTDDEEELVDLDESEMRVKLYGLLPTPEDGDDEAPEISSLDREIFSKAEIIPVFDDKGHFVKGQQAVKKPKRVYSHKYPKFACDTCYAAAKCPEYKAGYVCAYQKTFEKFDTRNMSDIIQSMQGMVEHNMTRMQRAMLMEVINGTIDPQVSGFIDQNMRLMMNLKQLYENGSAEVLRQTRIIRSDGSQEETTQITNPRSSGILEKMFAGYSSKSTNEDDDIVDEAPKPTNDRYKVEDED